MTSMNSCCCRPPDQFSAAQGQWAQQSTQVAHAGVTAEQNTEIVILTEEGDKVTLSYDAKLEASATTYDQMARSNSGYSETRASMQSVSAESNLALIVEGDLSRQERQEIKAVLKNLFKMVKDFIRGKDDSSATGVEKFSELTTISKVDADISIKSSAVLMSQSSKSEVSTRPAQAPEIPRVIDREEGKSRKKAGPIDRLADKMVEIVKDSGVDPQRILDRLDRLFSRLFRKYRQEGAGGLQKIGLGRKLLESFSEKLEKLIAEKEDNGPVQPQKSDEFVLQNEPAVYKTEKSVSQTSVNMAYQEYQFNLSYSAAEAE